jgi:hypothetical protein
MFDDLKNRKGFPVGAGIIIGVVIGALTGSPGLWIAGGIMVGAATEYILIKRRSKG